MSARALDLGAQSQPSEPVEVELKLLATDAAPLGWLARRLRLGPARLGPVSRVVEVDRYLDTADGRLAAVQWACRLRTRGEATIVSLKGPPLRGPAGSPIDGGIHRRPEVEGPAELAPDPRAWPPSAARSKLLALAGEHRLVERFALDQDRAQRAVQVGELRVGVLTLDRVRVRRGHRPIGRLWSVELELGPDVEPAPTLLGTLLAALEAVPGLSADPMSKLQHAEAMLARARV